MWKIILPIRIIRFFEGTIPEHYAYEKKMTRWMREGALEQMSLPMCKKLDSAAEVEERLQELHDRYLFTEKCVMRMIWHICGRWFRKY